jgi:prepilin-type N-terminal cleavage/methylation domain-containing protein
MKNRIKNRYGFTLIELIATIAIAGIIMIMILPYFQSGITESHRSAQMLQDAVTLQRAMESINGAYRALILDKVKTNLDALSASIGPAGSSFNNSYGVYAVIENGYISFACVGLNCAEQAVAGPRILKVTLASPTRPGFQLTRLFNVIEEVL